MDTKTRPVYMLFTKDPLQTESERMEKIFHANGNQKKAGGAILISDKIDFKIKIVTRDKEGHYIMIKGSIQEEDIIIVNIYTPNIGEPQYIRQMLTAIKGEIDSNTVIVGGDSPGDAVVKNQLANARDMGSSPGLGRSHIPWSN